MTFFKKDRECSQHLYFLFNVVYILLYLSKFKEEIMKQLEESIICNKTSTVKNQRRQGNGEKIKQYEVKRKQKNAALFFYF